MKQQRINLLCLVLVQLTIYIATIFPYLFGKSINLKIMKNTQQQQQQWAQYLTSLDYRSTHLSFAQRVSLTNSRVFLPGNSLVLLSYLKVSAASMITRFNSLNIRSYSSSTGGALLSVSLSNINFARNVYRVMDPIYDKVRHGGSFVVKVHCGGIILFSILVDDSIQFTYIVDSIVHQMSLSGPSDESERCLIRISLHNHQDSGIMSNIGVFPRRNVTGRREYSTNSITSSSTYTFSTFFRMSDFDSLENFSKVLKEYNIPMNNVYTVYARIRYNKDSFFMLGNQFGFNYTSEDKVIDLFDTFQSKFEEYFAVYSLTNDNVLYVQLTFVKLDRKLYSDLGLINNDNIDSKDIKIVKSVISIPSAAHITKSATELTLTLDDSLMIDNIRVVINNIEVNFLDLIVEKAGYINKNHSDNVTTFNSGFKFYYVRSRFDYVIGINTSNGITEMFKYGLSGVLLDRVLDRHLSDGIIRSKGSSTIDIDNKGVVTKHSKTIKLSKLSSYKLKYDHWVAFPNIGVIDTETYLAETGVNEVYALGFKTNLDKSPKVYYIGQDKNSNVIVLSLIDEILRTKYNGIKFYCHNLGGYDVVFIMKVLQAYNQQNPDNQYSINCIFRDDTVIKLTISKDNRKVEISDSYLILNSSLAKLGKDFGVSTLKSYFPYNFVREDKLFYVGETPDISFYNNISLTEYNSMVSDRWDLKDMTLKYLKDDLNSLYEVLCTANKQIHKDYHINIVEGNTISSIAMKLYLNKYYKDNIASIVKTSLYNDIKLSYFGGITEVYKPYGENLYYYDVNSLYPYAAINDMPGLSCEKVEFYKPRSIDGLFGFFHCSIESPGDVYLGCLPIRDKTGILQPLGKWEGWYFSEELKFAKDNGYNITVNKGYIFNRESRVFDSYVGEIYKVKSNPRNNSQKVIAKSLLNNLLGRFGISLDKPKTVIVSSIEFSRLGLVSKIHSYRKLDNDMVLVTFSDRLDYDIISQHNLDFRKVLDRYKDKEISVMGNCNIAIASAVTSYARIHMSKLKQYIFSKGGSLYYSDTDSLITDIVLPAEMVSPNKIGLLKLEHIIQKGIFITGKTYCFIDDKGNYINKIKGLRADSLSYGDYDNLLHGKTVRSAIKNISTKNWTAGDVKIGEMLNVTVNSNSYTKRTKIMDNGLWVNTTPNIINKKKKYHTYAGKNYFTKSLVPYVSKNFLILHLVSVYPLIPYNNNMYLVVYVAKNTSVVIFYESIVSHNIFISKGLSLSECLYSVYLSTLFLIVCIGYLSSFVLKEEDIADVDLSDITIPIPIPSKLLDDNISYFDSWLSLFNNNGEGKNYSKHKFLASRFNTTEPSKSSVILDELKFNNASKLSDSSEIKASMVYLPQVKDEILFSPFTPTTLIALEDELAKTDHKIKQMIGNIDELSLADKRRLSSLIDEKDYFISQHAKHVQSLLTKSDISVQNSDNKLMNLDKLESEIASHRKDILEYRNKLVNDNKSAVYDKNILETSFKSLSDSTDNWKQKLSQEEIKFIDNMDEPFRTEIKCRLNQENSYK